ncbi:MAG: nuclear transport factor 2 family protein [Bacteroidota bacterium]
MTNKEVIRKLNKGFEAGDEEAILSCLTDDVHWNVAGYFTANGKEEYRKQIANENFSGLPVITIINEIEENNQVAVEGVVRAQFANGDPFKAFFHNTYRMENGKVKAMTSYLVPVAAD